jgi:hypothetical protein
MIEYNYPYDFSCNYICKLLYKFDEINENPEKRLSPTLKGGDLRRFSNSDFQQSKKQKSLTFMFGDECLVILAFLI